MTVFLILVSGRTGGRQQTPAEARSAPGTVVSSLWMDVLTDELVKRTLTSLRKANPGRIGLREPHLHPVPDNRLIYIPEKSPIRTSRTARSQLDFTEPLVRKNRSELPFYDEGPP
ncbi:hypothetical protein [Gordonia sp. OPL2]|uniref:hypothetical protein n=1 Tax=Gordonia sp. OPL2 TaxID=2486274 RepID=UPI001656588D|nr:hypothetical protein [Gordonia sp. OPL2]